LKLQEKRESSTNCDYILDCQDITKSYGGTRALKGVQLRLKKGQVHALVGENGAGKSTLMNIISGLVQPNEGSILFEGQPYRVSTPSEAIHAGISMIHQELNPEPYLSIAESIFLNREDTIKGTPLLDKKKTLKRATAILEQFDIDLNPKMHMEHLTLAQMQMIEIVKAVSTNARLVLMDEPTSSLDSEETERLFSTIKDLQSKGVTIVYISHRMDEIFTICDSYSVFRDGMFIGSGEIEDVSKDQLISMMVGRNVDSIFPKTENEIGKTVFRAENLCGDKFKDISFEVRAGEILGIAGLVGSGRSETMRAIFGLDQLESGKMFLDGKEIKIRKVRDALDNGIAMINEDRKDYGLCLFRSIKENISLPSLKTKHRCLLINQKKENEECLDISSRLSIKMANLKTEAFSLSGGNQQKVVVAKWLMDKPKLIILDEPTRGVDVGAKAEIHSLMGKFASEGMAIIMVSSELPEVMGMSDRILIYHEGSLNGEVSRKDILSGKENKETILRKEFGRR
jgi:ribose transport system ATP-binding protein/inositol transport system ATP-binding protein